MGKPVRHKADDGEEQKCDRDHRCHLAVLGARLCHACEATEEGGKQVSRDCEVRDRQSTGDKTKTGEGR